MRKKSVEKKVRTHRFVIRNVTPSDAEVRERMMSEVGDVDVKGWRVEGDTHFTGPVLGGTNHTPQRDTTVVVEYTE